MQNKPGWAVKLDGEQADLQSFRHFLPGPFDPWIEDYQADGGLPEPILRSQSWEKVTNLSEIYRDAARILELLSGELLLMHSDAKPVKLRRVIKFGPDGKLESIDEAITGIMNVTLEPPRMRAYGWVGDPPEQSESALQKWFREANDSDDHSDLFHHLNHMDNWYDLYKAMEITRRMFSTPLPNPIFRSDKMWGDIWQTANCHRHAPNLEKFPFPDPIPEFGSARKFILRTIAKLLMHSAP